MYAETKEGVRSHDIIDMSRPEHRRRTEIEYRIGVTSEKGTLKVNPREEAPEHT